MSECTVNRGGVWSWDNTGEDPFLFCMLEHEASTTCEAIHQIDGNSEKKKKKKDYAMH